MVSEGQLEAICSPKGVHFLLNAFQVRERKNEAFAHFCGLFARGRQASSPSQHYARNAHKTMFMSLAPVSQHQTPIEEIKISYIDAASHLKSLVGSKSANLSSEDCFSAMLLIDQEALGYITWQLFTVFVDYIITSIKQGNFTPDSCHRFYLGILDSSFQSILNSLPPPGEDGSEGSILNHDLFAKLSHIAADARRRGLHPISTLCHIGSRQHWSISPAVMKNLIQKLSEGGASSELPSAVPAATLVAGAQHEEDDSGDEHRAAAHTGVSQRGLSSNEEPREELFDMNPLMKQLEQLKNNVSVVVNQLEQGVDSSGGASEERVWESLLNVEKQLQLAKQEAAHSLSNIQVNSSDIIEGHFTDSPSQSNLGLSTNRFFPVSTSKQIGSPRSASTRPIKSPKGITTSRTASSAAATGTGTGSSLALDISHQYTERLVATNFQQTPFQRDDSYFLQREERPSFVRLTINEERFDDPNKPISIPRGFGTPLRERVAMAVANKSSGGGNSNQQSSSEAARQAKRSKNTKGFSQDISHISVASASSSVSETRSISATRRPNSSTPLKVRGNNADMSIFKQPRRSQENINAFDARTLKWKPQENNRPNKYNERFQTTADLVNAAKINAVFYS